MGRVVDPGPIIDERLKALALEYQPEIDELARTLRQARGSERRSLRIELRAAKRRYSKARREVKLLRSILW